MPTGAFMLTTIIAATAAADIDRAASGNRATLESQRWARVGLRGPLSPNAPSDIRDVSLALKDGQHDERGVQARALPMIHWAIQSLADDDVRWNAHGARRFLRLAGPLAVPFLEIALVTGDTQQRTTATHLLLDVTDVSDPAAVASTLVSSMKDDQRGFPYGNCMTAFRTLARNESLLALARPALIRALDDPDEQLRLNAAQLLCVAGETQHADRVVELLAPMLDDDDHSGTAVTAIPALGLLGWPALAPLRDLRSERDAQGRMLTDDLIYWIAGPGAAGGRRMTSLERSGITTLTHIPARDIRGVSPLCTGERNALWGERGSGPWRRSGWRHEGLWTHGWTDLDAAFADKFVHRLLATHPERVARARMEYVIEQFPPIVTADQVQELRDRFEHALLEPRPESGPQWCPNPS